MKKWFWIGSRTEVRDAAAARMQRPATGEPLAAATAGDLVLVDARADADSLGALPTGHAFGVVRSLKERRGPAVYVIHDQDDRYGPGLARFCLADGTLTWHPSTGQLAGCEQLEAVVGSQRPSFEDLLKRLEQSRSAASGESSLHRLLRFEREDSLLNRLQDPETGLFDGPYATLKLDEEWKRAHRFHQPLSLLLLDLGIDFECLSDADRRAVLAEAAGVFLNECRDIDVLARFAPTVFLFLLPGTGPDGAEVLARRTLESLRSRLSGEYDLAPACGLASVPSAEIPDRKAFLLVAETCLQRAVGAGAFSLSASWQ